MKFRVTKTSYYGEAEVFVELNTLEEFIEWVRKQRQEVIVKTWAKDLTELEIYDGWRE
jgi:hypothetical protein